MATIQIELGAFAPTLVEQLKGNGSKQHLEYLERVASAITLLHVRGFITDSQADSARKRLMKAIQNTVSNYHKT